MDTETVSICAIEEDEEVVWRQSAAGINPDCRMEPDIKPNLTDLFHR